MKRAALKLRAARLEQAKKIENEITSSIRQLGMPKGWVEIAFSPLEKNQPHGMDKVDIKYVLIPDGT